MPGVALRGAVARGCLVVLCLVAFVDAKEPGLKQKQSKTYESGAPTQMLSLRRVLHRVSPEVDFPAPAGFDLVKQVDYVLAAVPSLLAFLAFNHVVKFAMQLGFGGTRFPAPLVGMFLFFFAMLGMSASAAAKFVEFFEPGVTLLTNFLPALFAPGLIRTPAAFKAGGVSTEDFAKFGLAIAIGGSAIAVETGMFTELIMRLTAARPAPAGKSSVDPAFKAGTLAEPASKPWFSFSAGTPAAPAAKASAGRPAFKPWFSGHLECVAGVLTAATGLLALRFPALMPTFYVLTTFFSYIFAARLPRFMSPTFSKFWHPLMTTYFVGTALLALQGMLRGKGLDDVLGEYLVPGASWNGAAGNLIMFFLEPAIISFSFGLFARKQLLWENAAAILGGAFCAAFAGILTLAWSARVVGVPHSLSLALMPRATAALAVVQAEMIGASAALTTVHCCLIGVFGANFGGSIMDALGLTSPISRGVAQGGAGLAVGSAALAQNDPSAFPFGTLTMSLASTIATLLFSMPSFQHLVFWVAGISR